MNTAHLNRFLTHLLSLLILAPSLLAQSEGPGGHFYEVAMEPGITWQQAKEKAEAAVFNGVHGYLATITSAEEDAFIESLRQQAAPGGYGALWIGGSQESSAATSTDQWFWVNGEGPVPMNGTEGAYANWQAGEPNDYNGPGSENFLTTGHFNSPGWNDESNGGQVHGYVIEYPGGATAPTVGVAVVDPVAIENSPDSTAPVDPAVFEFTRSGDLSLDLPVFYSIHGTALNGVDYNEIPRSMIIPAGQSSVRLSINPRPDVLTVVEEMETVGIRIEPSLILSPNAAYEIDHLNRDAAAVIFEHGSPENPAISIAVPRNGATYKSGEIIHFIAVAHAPEPVGSVTFFAGDIIVGSATRSSYTNGLSFFEFSWNGPGAGSPDIHAKMQIDDMIISSSSVRVTIEQTPETPVVSIRYVDPPPIIVAPGTDYALGHFEVTRTGSTAQNLQVFYSVSGTATAGADYERLQGYIVIGANRSTARIQVTAIDDLIDEPTESVILSLVPFGPSEDPTAPANYVINFEQRSAVLPIVDNDEPDPTPVISIGLLSSEVVEPGGTIYPQHTDVIISRTGSTQFAQRVYLGYEGTATPNVDFGRAFEEVIIPAGSSMLKYSIAATPDLKVEGTETAIIRIAPPNFPTNPDPANRIYEISAENGSATLTIYDAQSDPILPRVSIHTINNKTHEPGPTVDVAPATFLLRRTGPTNTSLLVLLSYSGTASNEVDYTRPAWTAFKPGEAELRVEIYAKDDSIAEPTETIVITVIPPPSGASQQYAVDPEKRTVTLEIIDNDSQGGPLITIEAPDPIATEPAFGSPVSDTAEFLFTRHGDDLTRERRVWFSLHGTAQNGADYSLPNSVVIPAGQVGVRLQVVPVLDGDPNESHHYEFISAPGITWEQARLAAEATTHEGVQGHLATITSAEEDQHIDTLRQESGLQVLWVGGYQEPGETSATEGWQWVNNEGPIPGTNSESPYANWLLNEPNDYWGVGSENYLAIGWQNGPGWNDQNDSSQGYVIEYDLPTGTNAPLERMETLAVRLEPSPLASPLPGYQIELHNRIALAVIFEHEPPADGAIEVAFPSPGYNYTEDQNVEFYVAAFHPTVDLDNVEYRIFGDVIGSSTLDPNSNEDPAGGLEVHRFHWTEAVLGTFVLQARAEAPNDLLLTSSEIPFTVRDNNANTPPVVAIVLPSDGAIFMLGEAVTVRAEATDPDGIHHVSLLVDDVPVAVSGGDTLTHVLTNLPPGAHTLQATTTDIPGANGISPVVNILVRHRDEISFVERRLPASFSPGTIFLVRLEAVPPAGTYAFAVEDQPPQGWVVSGISYEGEFDPVTGKVKFGPFTDSARRTLTYWITPPANAAGRYQFTGRSSANGASYPITGDEFVELVQQHHPADVNQNFAIVLDEATAYGAAWKAGDSWPTGPVPIPLSYVTSAARIWKRGEVYVFDASAGPAPACWVPVSESPVPQLAAKAAGSATRLVSGEFTPGIATTVQIAVTPSAGSSCYALEEKPPRGWIVSNISHSGAFDELTGTIRWGVFVDASARTLSYTLTPRPGITAVGNFSGHISFDGQLAEFGSGTPVVAEGPAAIEITGTARTAAGITLQISGPEGQTAVIESTSDFVTWTHISSIFIPNGIVEFTDNAAGSDPRFYRLRVQ